MFIIYHITLCICFTLSVLILSIMKTFLLSLHDILPSGKHRTLNISNVPEVLKVAAENKNKNLVFSFIAEYKCLHYYIYIIHSNKCINKLLTCIASVKNTIFSISSLQKENLYQNESKHSQRLNIGERT